ncbi:MAG: biotin/lipoyl-containing protein [Lachnospiraceae bacterium]|nr:biotin/lipoyl-containing protein [Lachnospiraceae bacterium]
MVQTLNGSWYLWLVPLFLVCLFVMIPASLSELGMTKKKKRQDGTGTDTGTPASETAKEPQSKNAEEEDIVEILILAAAAYTAMTGTGRGGNRMRNLKITVNGKTYDVTVEEENNAHGFTPRYSGMKTAPAAPASPMRSSITPAQPRTAPKAAPAPAALETATGEGVKLEAPLSGRIVEIVAPEGTAVKAGDTVIVMEAMKLQSEICAECDGTVSKILVKEKQDVVTGDALAVIS